MIQVQTGQVSHLTQFFEIFFISLVQFFQWNNASLSLYFTERSKFDEWVKVLEDSIAKVTIDFSYVS